MNNSPVFNYYKISDFFFKMDDEPNWGIYLKEGYSELEVEQLKADYWINEFELDYFPIKKCRIINITA